MWETLTSQIVTYILASSQNPQNSQGTGTSTVCVFWTWFGAFFGICSSLKTVPAAGAIYETVQCFVLSRVVKDGDMNATWKASSRKWMQNERNWMRNERNLINAEWRTNPMGHAGETKRNWKDINAEWKEYEKKWSHHERKMKGMNEPWKEHARNLMQNDRTCLKRKCLQHLMLHFLHFVHERKWMQHERNMKGNNA